MRQLSAFRKLSRGVVLAEFAMSCAIGGLVLSVLPAFYLASTRLYQRETGEIGAREQTALGVMRMKKELRNARSTSISSDGRTLTLVLPAISGTWSSSESMAIFDSQGQLINGDQVQYYFQGDSGSTGGCLFRRVTHASGSTESPRLVAQHVYPQLNPLVTSGSSTRPIFAYDSAKRTVTITVTAAGPRPSTSTFEAKRRDPVCTRHGTPLVRVATTGHPEGVVMCSQCGASTVPSSEVATYQATLLLRNR
jgi:Tfp pilus assembly protein PilW